MVVRAQLRTVSKGGDLDADRRDFRLRRGTTPLAPAENPRIPTAEKINHDSGWKLYTGCMPQKDHNAADSQLQDWTDSTPRDDGSEIVQLSAARSRAADEAAAAIARQLNGPLTALMLYMNEIKQHSGSQTSANRVYLQQVVDNALQQTERVYALVKQLSDNHPG